MKKLIQRRVSVWFDKSGFTLCAFVVSALKDVQYKSVYL